MEEYIEMGKAAYSPIKQQGLTCPWGYWPHTYERVDAWNKGWKIAEAEYRESLFSESDQKHAGRLKGVGDSVWHTRPDAETYWCGLWHDRHYTELYRECQSIMGDLLVLHPGLKE